MFDENTKQQKTYTKMIKYKTKEEVLKDIEEYLMPWEQKELAEEIVSKYIDLNEYIDNNRDNIDIEAILDNYIKHHTTDELLDKIDDAYGIAEYVSNDRYLAEYMLDEFKTRPSDFVDALNRSILTLICKKAHYFSGGMNCTTNIHIFFINKQNFLNFHTIYK